MSEDQKPDANLRWQRREERRQRERERMKKHGARLARVYRDAVLKRVRDGKRK